MRQESLMNLTLGSSGIAILATTIRVAVGLQGLPLKKPNEVGHELERRTERSDMLRTWQRGMR